MPEERGLYKKMKVGEHLIYLARLKGLSAADSKKHINHWLEKFEITDWWNKKIEELSKGMQQKVQFIATVVHQPTLLILDEPFSGLDPINSKLIKNEIFELRRTGTTVIFSTHRMEQVEEICEFIALINKGKNILSGPVHDIRQQYKEHKFEVRFIGILPEIQWPNGFEVLSKENDQVVIKLKPEISGNEILKVLIPAQVEVASFREILPAINDIFIQQVSQSSYA
jgi:ABC-2 type transport system ATP-binding protein